MPNPQFWIGVTIIAGALQSCAYDQPLRTDTPIEVRLNADPSARCSVGDAPVSCDGVGTYLRDDLRIPIAADIHLSINRDAHYAQLEAMIRSIRDAGYRKLGFIASEAAEAASPN